MVSSLKACRTLCEISGWRTSNLRAQKVLYFAHMHLLGLKDKPLINETFQAWDYGPVAPNLYHTVKMFGKHPIQKFVLPKEGVEPDTIEYEIIKVLHQVTHKQHYSSLIRSAHWENGAWYDVYDPGVPHIDIPNDRIKKEFHDREELRREAQSEI